MTLLNDLEDVRTYLVSEDTFFYSMVYDPNMKSLLVDKGDIRVGTNYQAEVPPFISPGLPSLFHSPSVLTPPLSLPHRGQGRPFPPGYQGVGAQQDARPQGGAVLGGGSLHWNIRQSSARRGKETTDQPSSRSCRRLT